MSLFILDKDNPNPKVGDTLRIRLRNLKDGDGRPYNLSAATIFATIKDSLSDDDANALAKIDSSSDSTQFVLDYADSGNIDVIFTPTDLEDVVHSTLYYIDVRASFPTGEVVSLMRDTLIFDLPVTLTMSGGGS